MSQQFADTEKGRIEYRLEGEGPTILVLNGGHCSRETRLSHERLARFGFSVLTPSRPGYDATPPEVGKSAEEAADALAALLDVLAIPETDVIGISAGGPTALALAQRHPAKVRRLVLESAVTLPWDERTRRASKILFGPAEGALWALIRLVLRVAPGMMLRAMMSQLSVLDAREVIERMSAEDLLFVRRMIATSRSGRGFVLDVEHRVDDLRGIRAPVLAMYSPNDRAVPPEHAHRVAREVAGCELFEAPADSHVIWIGPSAQAVWERRLAFLSEPPETARHR